MQNYHSHPFWGSSNLKGYFYSPLQAKYNKDNATNETSEALSFGTLLHKYIECKIKGETFPYQVVAPLINPKTGNAYGSDTDKQKLHLSQYENPILESDLFRIKAMFKQLSITKEFKFWSKKGEPEMEFYDETDTTKWKPDLLLKHQIIDWKTCQVLNLKSIISDIYKYKYDFSAAHYQAKELERTGTVKSFFWVFMQSVEPFDFIIVDASEFIMTVEDDIVLINKSTHVYNKIMDIHRDCIKTNNWPGLSSYINPDELQHTHYLPLINNSKF